jgi:hypothetical protein
MMTKNTRPDPPAHSDSAQGRGNVLPEIPAKSHVKLSNHPNSKIKTPNPNKLNPLQTKNNSAKLGILVSLNPLK